MKLFLGFIGASSCLIAQTYASYYYTFGVQSAATAIDPRYPLVVGVLVGSNGFHCGFGPYYPKEGSATLKTLDCYDTNSRLLVIHLLIIMVL